MTSVILLCESVGFPNGMAATQRLKVFAKMLTEEGFRVKILCLRVEKPINVENNLARGSWFGVDFEYTTGTTIRPENFFFRRWVEFRGVVIGIWRLFQLKSQKKVDAVFSFIDGKHWSIYQFVFIVLSQILRIPYVLEVCERPWVLDEDVKFPLSQISPLRGVRGVICISEYLREWSESEKQKINKKMYIIKIPILIDKSDFTRNDTINQSSPSLLFASSGYYETAKFIIDAMEIVWHEYLEARLIITGFKPESLETKLLENDIKNNGHNHLIELTGYIPREQLLCRYSQANALLIPLSDDISSRARFPTKIGEYLNSERPIITSAVGEINQYFNHGENALISEPDNVESFAKEIIFAIRHPDQANQIGKNGKKLADKYFDYQKYGPVLRDYFLTVINHD